MHQSAPLPLRTRAGAYIALTKPRIIELLLVTTVPTMVVAARGLPPGWLVVNTVLGGTLAAGGANAINMFVDRDIDRLMKRTQHRPLVTGVIPARNALVFAIGLEVVAFLWLWTFANLLSAVLAVSACLFYVFVYTLWLKRSSTHNIVIGGAAGAVPVLVGWSAVTGSLAWAPVILFGVIFYWTPPHFWALAIRYRDDYTAADVPMLPSVVSPRTVASRILVYTLLLWACTIVFSPVAGMGNLYLGAAVVLGAVFMWYAVTLLRRGTPDVAMRLFTYSITYITLLFGAMAADQLLPRRLNAHGGSDRMTVTQTRPEAADTDSTPAGARAPGGFAGLLGNGDHKTIGRLYIGTSLLFLLLAAVAGGLVGAERVDADRLDVLGRDSFSQVFTLHSVSAVFLFLLPFLLGLAFVVVPLQVGASTIAFPRAAAASFWAYLVSGGILIAAYAMNGGPFGGDANGVDLFLVSFIAVLGALVLATVCVVTTVLTLRAAGMTLDRTPLYSWSMVVAGTVWLLSLPILAAGALLLYVDTHYNVGSFRGVDGIYDAMLWAFQQPQIYAFALPALGIVGDIVPVFARTRLGLRQRQAAMVAIGLAGALGFGGWAQRWVAGAGALTDQALYMVVAFAILLPFLVVATVTADTLRRGSIKWRSPLVFSIAALLMLLAGAAAGAASAIDQLDLVAPDTTWMSAQAHYVLLGVAIAAIGGVHFWAPKLLGRELREGAGYVTALLLLAGTVALALPDIVSGGLDQLRAIGQLDLSQATKPVRDGVEALNTVSLIGGGIVVVGVVVFLVNLLGALIRRPVEPLADDVWGGHTLEWATASPPPTGNFVEPPVVESAEPLLDTREAETAEEDAS